LIIGKSLGKLSGHTRSVEDLIISPDGAHLYSCSSDTTIRKWDLKTGEEIGVFVGHETSVYRLVASFDDDVLWSGEFFLLIQYLAIKLPCVGI
jgi:WD40 repeat protein